MRISRPQMWMDVAEVAARRATCFRGNVGALVVKDNDVLAIGYNGPPSGQAHCVGTCPVGDTGGCVRSDHAEKNAINRATTKLGAGSKLHHCDVYCTYSPCLKCAEIIFNNYTNRFFYRYSYRDPAGLQYLLDSTESMGIYRVTPAGFIISERSKNIIAPEDLR